MQFQKMHTRHLNAVILIEHDVYDDPWTKQQIRNMLPNENARMFVAIDNNEIVAYMILVENDEGWVIENLTVDIQHRRRGIGTELLKLAKTIVGEQIIRIYVADKYLPMHLLLKKNGYVAQKVEKDVHGDHYSFILKVK